MRLPLLASRKRSSGLDPITASLITFANLTTNLDNSGTGGVVPAIIGDADNDRYVLDYQHVWHACRAEEARFQGLRRVENLVMFSEDMNDSLYSVSNNAVLVVAEPATQIIYDGTAGGEIRNRVTIVNKGIGRCFIFSVDIFLVTGTITADSAVRISLSGSALSSVSANIGDAIAGTTKRFTIEAATDASGTTVFAEIISDDIITLEITNWQVESSTLQVETSIPSEYVSSDVAVGTNIFTDPPDTIESGWTDDGGGSYTGASTTNNLLMSNIVTPNVTYFCSIFVDSHTSGAISFNVGGTTSSNFSASGIFTAIIIAGVTDNDFKVDAVTSYTATISSISIRSVDHGANADRVKYFSTLNANSVTDNVVTESVGAEIDNELISNTGIALKGYVGNGSNFIVTTGWTAGDAASELSIDSGNIRINNGDSSQAWAYNELTTVSGQIYTIWFNSVGGNAAGKLIIGTDNTVSNDDLYNSLTLTSGGDGLATATFKATSTSSFVKFMSDTSVEDDRYDFALISVKASYVHGYFMEEAETNEITQPRDLTDAAWTNNGTVQAQDETGIDGCPNIATTLEDDSAIALEYVEETVTVIADTKGVLFSVYVKKDSDISRFPVLYAELITSGSNTIEWLWLNTLTGVTVEASQTQAGFSVSGSIDMGDWWLLYGVITNTSNTSAIMRLYPSAGTVIGTQAVAATGTAIFDCATISQDTPYPTSPILATGVATRPGDIEAELDILNFSNSLGSMVFQLTSFFPLTMSLVEGLISASGTINNFLYYQGNAIQQIRLTDDTSNVSNAAAWTLPAEIIQVKVRWNSGSSKMNISINGVIETEVAFDGSFSPGSVLTFFKSLVLGGAIKNLSIYDTDLGDLWLSQL